MTYTELTSLMEDFLENSETSFTDNIPLLVRQAESRIYSTVRTPDQRLSVSSTTAVAAVATPAGFWEPLGLWITVSGAYVPLLQKSLSFLRTAYPSGTGQPAYYAITGATSASTTITLGPAPDATYTYTLNYIGSPPSVVDNATTWLSLNCSDVLLYGSLLEGYMYMKGEQSLMAEFQKRFDTALAQLKVMCEGRQLIDEYRNPPIQVGVQ